MLIIKQNHDTYLAWFISISDISVLSIHLVYTSRDNNSYIGVRLTCTICTTLEKKQKQKQI